MNWIIAYAVVGILFLAGTVMAIQWYLIERQRSERIVLAAAGLFLALLQIFQAVQVYNGYTPPEYEIIPIAGLGIVGLLGLIGVYLAWQRDREKQTSLALLQEEITRFRAGFAKSQGIYVIKDLQGNYLYTNPAYQRLLGKPEQNLVGETDFKFFPRAQATSFRQEEEKALDSGEVKSRDEEIHGIDGIHWLRLNRIPLLEGHTPKGLLVSGYDIASQKQAERELSEALQGLSALNDLVTAFNEPGSLSFTWQGIAAGASRLAGTSHCAFWQIEPDQARALLKSGAGKLKGLPVAGQNQIWKGLIWKTWQSGLPTILHDDPGAGDQTDWMQEQGFHTAIGLPIKVKNQVFYAITLFYEKAGVEPNKQLLQSFNILGQLIIEKIQNAELAAQTQVEQSDWKSQLDKLNYRVRLEHILAVIAAHFITLDLEKVDEGITRSLQTIARFAAIDRCYLAIFPVSGWGDQTQGYWSNNSEGLARELLGDINRIEFQWLVNRLNQLETIHIGRIAELPQDMGDAASFMSSHGIKSFTAIPLLSNRSLIGFLGFEAVQNEVEWSQDILGMLKVNGEMFVNLLERKWTARAVRTEHDKMGAQIQELELRTQENELVTEMGDLLQASRTADEAYPIIVRYIQRLIPASSGGLYIIRDPKDPAENVAGWGKEPPGASEHELALNECWALRRGRTYVVSDPGTEPVCTHIKEPIHTGYLCVPLIAQGVAIGVLHVRFPSDCPGQTHFDENQQRIATKVGEYIAMSLTNLKLRDELRSQAIRDPLTKLFNRRYMEETLDREIRRASRHSTSVGVIMFDIDRMKPINDRFGHDAGDLLLKTLGSELLRIFRGEDVACRYGGDEFTIVLPEATLADVWRRAEQMREAIKRLDLKYDGKQIGPVTVSIGVAAYPDHGLTAERVLLASDAASYASKSEGGDRIMMGHKVTE